jgi:hypothetical protein
MHLPIMPIYAEDAIRFLKASKRKGQTNARPFEILLLVIVLGYTHAVPACLSRFVNPKDSTLNKEEEFHSFLYQTELSG